MSEKTIFDILHQMDTFTNSVMIKWNKMFNEDLGVSNVLTLGFINNNKKARPSDISKKLGLTPPTVTHLVEKLVKKELVERVLDDSDRRIIYLVITEKGKEVLKRANIEGQVLRREMFLKLTEEERAQLLALYEKLNS
ncbi:MarR family winged helix-turn-helix transcriptional regulator [Ornithinibacillus sp. 4-3]|uniref:MarR family winged helix-turn-helix transcriptional regulator n=1 Tax=Ornithinibacillus sp. 4-3 TaxID=3231488 RepID=A0AB39HND8_9BACI